MFWDKLERSLSKYPKWAEALRMLGNQLERVPPGRVVDPHVLSVRTEIPLGEVLALLGALSEESVGRLELRVVDKNGQEVAAFARASDLPPVVRDQFGEEIEVDPENIDLVFRLTPAGVPASPAQDLGRSLGRGPAEGAVPASALAVSDPVVLEAEMSDEARGNLVYRFWNLAASQRREIALNLNLIEASELVLPEPERYGRALLRAGERGLLDRVAEEVAQAEGSVEHTSQICSRYW